MKYKISEVKDWIVVPVYSDDDFPTTPYRVWATDEEIEKILESFAKAIIEDFNCEPEVIDKRYNKDSIYFYAGFSDMYVEVTATLFNSMAVKTAKDFESGVSNNE